VGQEDVYKTETLQESLATYTEKISKKKRSAAAAYELAIKSERNHQPGDQISYYVIGDKSRVRVLTIVNSLHSGTMKNRMRI
jgi:hypothetical protein